MLLYDIVLSFDLLNKVGNGFLFLQKKKLPTNCLFISIINKSFLEF